MENISNKVAYFTGAKRFDHLKKEFPIYWIPISTNSLDTVVLFCSSWLSEFLLLLQHKYTLSERSVHSKFFSLFRRKDKKNTMEDVNLNRDFIKKGNFENMESLKWIISYLILNLLPLSKILSKEVFKKIMDENCIKNFFHLHAIFFFVWSNRKRSRSFFCSIDRSRKIDQSSILKIDRLFFKLWLWVQTFHLLWPHKRAWFQPVPKLEMMKNSARSYFHQH